ncbi:MAG: flagellar hook-basal body complex protein, partial [Candidatus Omnitrophica bacterium]|nr:flagellar hook-basal body complex protein [Candidatus Omnitrophota bacterium]
MLSSLDSGLSGIQQFQEQLDVIGNNIANVNTTGFKGARAEFADSFSQTLQAATESSDGTQIGTGVATGAIHDIHTQGIIKPTGVQTDVAINGQGFFVVRDVADSAQYATRDGTFKLNNDGYLVTNTGLRVQGFTDKGMSARGDLRIDARAQIAANVAKATADVDSATAAKAAADAAADGTTSDSLIAAARAAADQLASAQAALTAAQNAGISSFNVDRQGIITIGLTDGTSFVTGQILLQNFQNPSALVKEGNNLLSGFDAAGPLGQAEPPTASGLGQLAAGALEQSNVDLANEFSSL